MDPSSIYVGGVLVALLIWLACTGIMFYSKQIRWYQQDWKVFVIGILCCITWVLSFPVATLIFYQKQKG